MITSKDGMQVATFSEDGTVMTIKCKRCGHYEDQQISGMDLGAFGELLEQFTKQHKHCEQPPIIIGKGYDNKTLMLVRIEDSKPVRKGTKLIIRDEIVELTSGSAPHKVSSSGVINIVYQDGTKGTYYSSVADLKWIEVYL